MSSAFEFENRPEDFIERLIRDHPELSAYRDELAEWATLEGTNNEDLEAFLDQDSFAPGIGVSRVATQSVGSGVLVPITFDNIDFQSSDVFEWDGATKITVGQRGVVGITVNITYAASAAGTNRGGIVILNSLTNLVLLLAMPPAAVFPRVTMGAKIWPLEAGDYFEVNASHDAGVNLNTTAELQLVFYGAVDG